MRFHVGDRVRVKDHWVSGKQNLEGEMDCWLGCILTIETVCASSYHVKEDRHAWYWFDEDLEPAPRGVYYLPRFAIFGNDSLGGQRLLIARRYAQLVLPAPNHNCPYDTLVFSRNEMCEPDAWTREGFDGVDLESLPNAEHPSELRFMIL